MNLTILNTQNQKTNAHSIAVWLLKKIAKQQLNLSLFASVFCYFVLSIVGAANADENSNKNTFSVVLAGDMPDISDPVSGRYAELQKLISTTRKTNSQAFFFFGGGSIGPSAFSNLDRGSHIVDLLNNIEPDAMGLAKRDFSFFEDELSLRAYEAAFPFVSSNLRDSRLHNFLDGVSNYALITKGDISFGFISVMDERLPIEYLTQNIYVTPPKEAINETAKTLRKLGADIIILHYFVAYDFVTALLDEGVIDLAFNSHTRLPNSDKARIDKDSRILHLSVPGMVRVADFEMSEGQLTLINDNPYQLNTLAPDPSLQYEINSYKFRLDRILDEQLGSWGADTSTLREVVRTKESGFANFIADTMRQFAGTQISIVNGGSIRGDTTYTAGSVITRRTIATELPFRSTLRAIEISGKGLLETLEYGLSGLEEVQGSFLHVSGIELEFDSSRPIGKRVVSVTIQGDPILPNNTYSVATTDYLASGGDGFEALTKAKRLSQTTLEETILVSDIVLRNVQLQKRLTNRVEGRLIDHASGGRQ